MEDKPATGADNPLSRLPSISEVDQYLREQGLPHGKVVREQVQAVLARFRDRLRTGTAEEPGMTDRPFILQSIRDAVAQHAPKQLRRVVNATGVVVHTNLGRAPLAPGVLEAARPLLTGYSNLEFNLDSGRRGERGGRVPELLAWLAGAEQALVVNNNASALLLLLSALAQGGEVVVSRGELVEIGGSFRLPDIMRLSGAELVEVGTTNRTRLKDYADAVTPRTVAFLKVHRSNFFMSGFVEDVAVDELAVLAEEAEVAVWNDWGSGNFYRFNQPALQHMTTVQQEVEAGAHVITFSGDKLLGSVQAGIVVGKEEPVNRMRRHPLFRSLRMDKVRLAMLEASLLDYLELDSLRRNNPTIGFLERTPADLEPMARRVLEGVAGAAVTCELVHEQSLVGGGALPEVRLDTVCLAVSHAAQDATALAAALRRREPPVVARVSEGRLLIDCRTLFEDDLPIVTEALRALG